MLGFVLVNKFKKEEKRREKRERSLSEDKIRKRQFLYLKAPKLKK